MIIIETSIFTHQVLVLMDDEHYRRLQTILVIRPDVGDIIPGSAGRPYRSTVKVVAESNRGGVQMNEDLFSELIASVKEGGAILRGEQAASRVFNMLPPDIKTIRDGFGLTQQQFAALLGISVRTLRNWEQGRRVPEGPARVLLQVAAKHPDAVLDVVQERKFGS